MTLKSKEAVKVLTVRGTSFAPADETGGSAKSEAAPAGEYAAKGAEFVKQELTKSDRPELTAAKVIVSGGELVFLQSVYKLPRKILCISTLARQKGANKCTNAPLSCKQQFVP